MDSEQVREDVWRKLSGLNVQELTQICTGLDLKMTLKKAAKRSSLYNAVLKHLMKVDEDEEEADEDDEEAQETKDAVFNKVNTLIDQLLSKAVKTEESATGGSTAGGAKGEGNVVSQKREVSTLMTNDAGTSKGGTSSPLINSGGGNDGSRVVYPAGQIHKLQEFKITGGTVACRGEGELDYISLSYQIQSGKDKGYRTKEIMAAVVKAMKAGSSMKKFYQLNPQISEEKFYKMIRSRYEVKDSATLMTEMSNSAQEPAESESNFLFRLMALKHMVMIVARDEGTPIGEEMVNKRFFHALGVGLRKEAVRLEIQPTLNVMTATDDELVDLISRIVARDTERRSKVKGAAKNASANAGKVQFADELELFEENANCSPRSMSKEDAILAEVRNLAVSMDELKTVKTDVQCLNKKMDSVEQRLTAVEKREPVAGGGRAPFRFIKCQPCEEGRKFCNHCSKCGAGDHKRKDCLN